MFDGKEGFDISTCLFNLGIERVYDHVDTLGQDFTRGIIVSVHSKQHIHTQNVLEALHQDLLFYITLLNN